MYKLVLIIYLISSSIVFAGEFLPSTFRASFDQEYISSLKGKIKKGHGQIEYKYPSNIRFETDQPSHVLFVTNGKKSWYYSFPFIEGEQGELTESSSKENNGAFTKFFDSLKNGLVANKFYIVQKNNNEATLIFDEKSNKTIGIKLAKIIFSSNKSDFNSIQNIELVYLDDKKSTMKLSNIQTNLNFDVDHFIFKAPQNTKIKN